MPHPVWSAIVLVMDREDNLCGLGPCNQNPMARLRVAANSPKRVQKFRSGSSWFAGNCVASRWPVKERDGHRHCEARCQVW
mmetsp:Transcript_11015/g.22960  ORF Transcript_11015/g.22960 Transcript_11015/m.22960 type:complete len:81 (-) Transcript_11015:455-697(-)